MDLVPDGLRILILVYVILSSGFCNLITVADYSIGTIIETTGPVRDSFFGTYSHADGNGSNVSGVYKDLTMTNGGSLSLTKQIGMTEGTQTHQGFETQKVIGYSSGTSGGHLIGDEYVLTSTDVYTNTSATSFCFGEPYDISKAASGEQSASFSIVNAHNLLLSTTSRSTGGTLDYALNIGSPANTSSSPGLTGTVLTAFHGTSASSTGSVTLYDRTLISGLIDTLSRLYHGEDRMDMTMLTSGTAFIHDKTIMEQKCNRSDTSSGEAYAESFVYTQDVMTNGGKANISRQVSGAGSIEADRIVSYASDGDSSIQAFEQAVATRMKASDENSDRPVCVFAGELSSSEEASPYKQASAQTGIAGVSSAQITSSTRISDPDTSKELNLAYNANIMIPVGFNESLIKRMKDTDNDGRFEDLNGNGHLDMNDLVLLFQNFRWIGESNISLRIDFNNNGRADYADIVTIFNAMNQTRTRKN
ncbi:hypothetical protein [Methanospirillum sp.]|nr:hypothetical protein [Methanospirillum sp.]HOL40486.1 hypothetical protein [Methanospirillum sp.]HPP76717.1 hypothetical protein [Methanospirillum sp.]